MRHLDRKKKHAKDRSHKNVEKESKDKQEQQDL